MSEQEAAQEKTDSAPVNEGVEFEAAPEVEAAEGAESAPADKAADPVESAPAKDPEDSDKYQQRMNKITREKYEAERRAEAAEKRAKELEEKAAQPVIQDVPPKPTLEGCGYDEAELERRMDERDKIIAANAKAEGEKAVIERERAAAAQRDYDQRVSAFAERYDAHAKDNPGFDQVANTALQVLDNSGAKEAILDDEKGPQLLAHLAENLEVADRLNNMSPYAAAREIGRLSATLETPKPKTTDAPAPVRTTLDGGAALPDAKLPGTEGVTYE
jgi:hypothetical protein